MLSTFETIKQARKIRGETIASGRRSLSWSQEDLARQAGIRTYQVDLVEKGLATIPSAIRAMQETIHLELNRRASLVRDWEQL